MGHRWRRARRTRWVPVAAGAVAGLAGGLIGIGLDSNPNFFLPGGMAGAVTGGVVAALVSDHGVLEDVLHAGLADVASSAAFFGVVYAGLITNYGSPVGVGATSVLYAVFGGLVAIPIAILSLAVAVSSGGVATLLQRGFRTYVRDVGR